MSTPDTPWVKARRSGGSDSSCFELRRVGDTIELRDSKDKGAGPILRFRPDELDAFLDGAKKGEFDNLLG